MQPYKIDVVKHINIWKKKTEETILSALSAVQHFSFNFIISVSFSPKVFQLETLHTNCFLFDPKCLLIYIYHNLQRQKTVRCEIIYLWMSITLIVSVTQSNYSEQYFSKFTVETRKQYIECNSVGCWVGNIRCFYDILKRRM